VPVFAEISGIISTNAQGKCPFNEVHRDRENLGSIPPPRPKVPNGFSYWSSRLGSNRRPNFPSPATPSA